MANVGKNIPYMDGMGMEHPPFADIFPIGKGRFPMCHVPKYFQFSIYIFGTFGSQAGKPIYQGNDRLDSWF